MTMHDRIRESRACDTLTALQWCVERQAFVSFVDDVVIVTVAATSSKGFGATLAAAVLDAVLRGAELRLGAVTAAGEVPGGAGGEDPPAVGAGPFGAAHDPGHQSALQS